MLQNYIYWNNGHNLCIYIIRYLMMNDLQDIIWILAIHQFQKYVENIEVNWNKFYQKGAIRIRNRNMLQILIM